MRFLITELMVICTITACQVLTLSANYDFKKIQLMNGYTNLMKLYWLMALKIGVCGLGIALERCGNQKNYLKKLKYLNPFEIATRTEANF